MADFSEISDVNSDEMTRMMKEMDNLDNELFNDSFKKSTPPSTSTFKDSQTRTDGELKKRVVFKDSTKDDLLADLLSDDEDSFKEKKNPIGGVKSNRMEDLFKIQSSTSVTNAKQSNVSNLKFSFNETGEISQATFSTKATNPQILKNPRKENDASNETGDVLTNLIDNPRAMDNKLKKLSLMEDLFEKKPRLSSTVDSAIHKVNTTESLPDISKRPTVEHATLAQPARVQTANYATKPAISREPRRGRRNSSIINDPLGLLSNDLLSDDFETIANESKPAADSSAQAAKVDQDLPEWLGGTKKTEQIKETPASNTASADKTEKVSVFEENVKLDDTIAQTDSTVVNENYGETVQSYPKNLSLLLGTQFDEQATIMAMQQQEHELRTATVLSRQNVQLNKVLDIQRSKLSEQEKQFNALIKMQLERQALLEKQMRTQQERIDRYIQTLMAQPGSLTISTISSTNADTDEGRKDSTVEKEEMEGLIQKLQLEKSELESTLRILNERHENEMTTQADCYRRQISFLEESLEKLEKRTRQEIEFLDADYAAKFEKLRDEKMQAENIWKEEIDNLKRDHGRYIKELYERHSENVRLLQKEQSEVIENISKAKQAEAMAIQNMTKRKTDVEDILQKVNLIIDNIKESQEKIGKRDEETIKFRENRLTVQEDDIQSQKLELEKQRKALEEHHSKLVETANRLDSRLTELIIELQKQSTHCNQVQETLTKKATYLSRERELFEENVKWERDHLQSLKESWMKEQERQVKLLMEEMEAVTAEKAKLKILSKLKCDTNDVEKIELEAAIKTAQEAIARANQERLRWQEKTDQLKAQRQDLQEKENMLVRRAQELENLTQAALMKKESGTRALKEAKHLEERYKEKLSALQTQLDALVQREKKIAAERFNVARERMTSRPNEAEKPERDKNPTISHNYLSESLLIPDPTPVSEITTSFLEIVDPNLLMLKLDLDEQLDTSNMYLQAIDS